MSALFTWPVNVETHLNHSTGVSDSYYRPRESELLTEYLNVADHLTVNEDSILRREININRGIKQR